MIPKARAASLALVCGRLVIVKFCKDDVTSFTWRSCRPTADTFLYDRPIFCEFKRSRLKRESTVARANLRVGEVDSRVNRVLLRFVVVLVVNALVWFVIQSSRLRKTQNC